MVQSNKIQLLLPKMCWKNCFVIEFDDQNIDMNFGEKQKIDINVGGQAVED